MVGSLFAVAAYDALSGAEVEGHVVGVFVLPKPNSVVTFNLSEKVFWDNATGLCKPTASGFSASARRSRQLAQPMPTAPSASTASSTVAVAA